jgi:hypothetical protein
MAQEHVVIAGGSGFLGRHLERALLEQDYAVTILTRRLTRPHHIEWDGRSQGDWTAGLDGAAAVVNLAGKNVSCRHTSENRHLIVQSRVESVNALQMAVLLSPNPPPVFIQASGLGYYGNRGARICIEDTSIGSGFLAEVCGHWEDAFYATELPHTRPVLMRIGLVLALDGGVLKTLTPLTRLFLGGAVGDGRQYMSWLHIDDLNRIFIEAIQNPALRGTYNVTSTQPVMNRDFMATLRQALNRPWSPSVPAPMVRAGAFVLRAEANLALYGQFCLPQRLTDQGFTFAYNDLDSALRDLFDNR